MKTKYFCGIALALLVNLGQAHAAVIVSNLSDAGAGAGTIYASGPPQDYAQEFLTGSQSVQLGSVIADLGAASGSFTASAELVANNAGVPGSTVLTTFTVPSISTAYSDLTFTPTSSVMLSANTDYWFVLLAGGTGSYKWEYTNTNSLSFPDYAKSNDGATWTLYTSGPFLTEVDSPAAASTTPEPASFLQVGVAGLVAFGFMLGRARTKNRA